MARIAYDDLTYKTSGENCQLVEDSIFQRAKTDRSAGRDAVTLTVNGGKRKIRKKRERCDRMVRELSVGNEIYK